MFKDRIPRRRPETTTQRRPRTRRGVRWSFFLAIVPIILVAGGTYYALRSPLLTVQEINVEGARSLDENALVDLTRLYGKSMLNPPLEAARARIQAIPDVRSVSISRSWPSTVNITIEERQPVAFWSVNGHDFVVDKDGIVLTAGTPDGPAPRIVEVTEGRTLEPGDRVHPDAVAFAQRILAESPRFLDESVFELEYEAGVGVTVIFDGGLRVTFGDERSYEYKIAVLSELLDQLSNQGIEPHAVDLRFGERVTYE